MSTHFCAAQPAWTHLTLQLSQLFGVLRLHRVGEQREQVDALLLLTVFFVLDLRQETKTEAGRREELKKFNHILLWLSMELQQQMKTQFSLFLMWKVPVERSYLTEHLRLLSDKLSLVGFWHQVVKTRGVAL